MSWFWFEFKMILLGIVLGFFPGFVLGVLAAVLGGIGIALAWGLR